MADERSVDVEDHRDPPADATPRAPIAAGLGRLPPTQEAWGAFVGHATKCRYCRDIDHGRCETGDTLWHTWETLEEGAFRRLHDETP